MRTSDLPCLKASNPEKSMASLTTEGWRGHNLTVAGTRYGLATTRLIRVSLQS